MNIRPVEGNSRRVSSICPSSSAPSCPQEKPKREILRRRIRQLLHTLLNAPFPVLQGQIYHIGFPGGQPPRCLAAADLQAQPQHHPALSDLGVTR